MKKIIGALVTAAAISFAGAAHAELMDSTFGNTVTIADAQGTVVVSYHFNADHTFEMTSAAGTAPGTWSLDGTNLCTTVGEASSCTPIEDHDVGDVWEGPDAEGNIMTITIVEGR